MGKGVTILVVEDEEFVRMLLQEFLEKEGFRVFLASGGREALEIFGRFKDEIDLVLLDLVLPDMGGREILEAMKALSPQVKVLVTTGLGGDRQLEEMEREGIVGVVAKPFDLPRLMETIEAAVDGETPLSH